jgi:predicted metal-binding membrane protein
LRVATTALDRQRSFLPLIGSLIALAWLTLLIWEWSPYGRYLDHGQWTEIGLAASLCRFLPAGPAVLPGLLYVTGWVLMSAAMMLPTAMPLLGIFGRLTAGRPDRGALMALVVLGYLLIWSLFGLAAHLFDLVLHAVVVGSVFFTFNGWMIGVIVLALAGAFQFSALKYHCLDKCRTPFGFVSEHWRGRATRWQAFLLGVHHGVFCVGCCWAIMLLMFVVGTGSVGWMLALGAVMAIEKNLPWGRRLSRPLGAGLLACSGAILLVQVWHWPA